MTTTKLTLPKIRRDRLSHAYILVSPKENREVLGQKLCASLLCKSTGDEPCYTCSTCRKIMANIHPDVLPITRPLDDKGKLRREVYVAQIREIGTSSVILPNEAHKKVYLIYDAEYMNDTAQNALLKLLEEPPSHVCFVLCTENPSSFLETISSRCVTLFCDKTEADRPYDETNLQFLRIISAGDRLELLRFCLSLEGLSATELGEFLQNTKVLITNALSSREDLSFLNKAQLAHIYMLAEKCTTLLFSNVSVKQVLGLISVSAIYSE